jgi:uncharacterized membrane protein
MSGARKYAFVQREVLFWVLFGVAAYLLCTNLGIAAGLILIVPTLAMWTWVLIVLRRRYKRQFPHGRRSHVD